MSTTKDFHRPARSPSRNARWATAREERMFAAERRNAFKGWPWLLIGPGIGLAGLVLAVIIAGTFKG